ncbi:MAG: hypothetical protein AAF125_17280 [Chloroflexota bacterium]
MQALNQLVKLAQAASVVGDLTRQKHTYTLPVMKTAETFYLHADNAAVRVVRWDRPQVEITIETRPPVGWRTATDYDENGVYVVAVRRIGFGGIASAVVNAVVPRHLHLMLRLRDGLVTLDHVHGTLEIPPEDALPPSLQDGQTDR